MKKKLKTSRSKTNRVKSRAARSKISRKATPKAEKATVSSEHFLEALVKRGVPIKHAVALDLRGHGDSEWPSTSRGYQHEDFLSDLAGLLKHLDKDSLTIIGHSLGGSMCLLYAAAFPEKVKRMVLFESLGPFARADDDVPNIIAERLKGRD